MFESFESVIIIIIIMIILKYPIEALIYIYKVFKLLLVALRNQPY